MHVMTRQTGLLALLFALAGALLAPAQSIGVRTLALRSGEMPKLFVKGAKGHQPLRFSAVQPTETVR